MWMSLLSLFDVCCIILQNNFGAQGLTLKPLHANGSLSRGGGGRQESQFHSLFFMQAAVIASIIYLHDYSCLLYVQVFEHEAIHHTELNIYFNNQHLLINISHNTNTELQSSNT